MIDTGPILFSWSELDAGRQCPHKWELAYRGRWVGREISRPLDMGSLWHQVLEAHYRSLQRGSSLSTAKEDARGVWLASSSAYSDTIEWMYGRYVEMYGADRQWKILGVEHEMLIQLDERVTLKLKMDLLIEDLNRKARKLVDHKSGQRLPSDKNLAFADQFGLYEAAMVRSGRPVLGSIYNAARAPSKGLIPVKDPDPPLNEWFERSPLYRTEQELDTIIEEALDDIYRLHSYRIGGAPRHPDEERCQWRCSYTLPCLHGRKHGPEREVELLEATGFTQVQERH